MWVGLIQSVEGLKSKDRFPEEEEILLQVWNIETVPDLLVCRFWAPDYNINCYLSFQPADLPTDCSLASFHNCMSKFSKISAYPPLSSCSCPCSFSFPLSLSLSVSRHTHTHTHTHTHAHTHTHGLLLLVLFFWGILTNTTYKEH